MALHNKIGRDGEAFAVDYLQRAGYEILNTNWRYGHKEIDIIARDGRWLVFVEVKTRTGTVAAADVISQSKMQFLTEAAEAFIDANAYEGEARIDVLLLTLVGNQYSIEHIRDAFR